MKPEDEKPAEENGGRGDDAHLSPVQQNKIIGMMIRQQWPVRQTDKIEAVETTSRNMASDDGRVSNGAVKNLLLMNAQNMEQEQRDNPQAQTVLHHHSGVVGVAALRQEFLNDPEYLDFQRQRALTEDLDAGALRPSREPGPMENGAAPDLPGPGANGHH